MIVRMNVARVIHAIVPRAVHSVVGGLTFFAATVWAIEGRAAASPSRDAIAAHRYLLGTWHCTYTVGKIGGTYTTTWSAVLDGNWLKQTYDQRGLRGFQAEYLVGYDKRHNAWVRFGAMTTGQYFAIRMTPTPNGGWNWKYLSFFSRKHAETFKPDAVFTRRSDAVYTVDGPTYRNEANDIVTEHHICRKA